MPSPKKGAPKRAFDRSSAPRKPGSSSPKHRGYRAEQDTPRGPKSAGDPAGAKKPRWNADERVARGRTPERRGTERDERSGDARRGERPNWEPREKPAARGGRPAGSGSYSRGADSRAGESRGGWRDDSPRGDRGGYGDRRPARDADARTGWRDSAPRDADRRSEGRGGYDRGERNDQRPARGDRTDRPARSYGDRPERSDRGYRSSDSRPVRNFDDRDDRRGGSGDRETRRPERDRSDRDFGRGAPRGSSRGGGAPRGPRTDRGFDDRRGPGARSFAPAAAHAPVDDTVLERLDATAIEVTEVEGASFSSLGLGDNIVRVLAGFGADAPFPIQAATIPPALEGRDVLGRARTGSGKTIAFGAPLVERMLRQRAGESSAERRRPGRAPRALILAPTRELALQIDRTVQPIARSVGLFTTQIYGGVPYARQTGALQRGVDIIVGTPGRVEDLVNRGQLDLSNVDITVLDEADHMCDLGFLEPVQRLLRETKDGGQKLLFSATLDSGVANLVQEFLVDPAVYEVADDDQDASTIEHRVFVLDQRDKRAVLSELAQGEGKKLVFARTRAFAEELADMLDDEGIPAVSLHGDLSQSRRTRNLEKLTSGRVQVLVATDVAARGIHVDDIELVIQADAPDEYKTYLHRAGRTGRAGKAGTVVTLVPRSRRRRVEELLQRAEIEAEWTQVVPGDATIAELAGAVQL